MNENFYIYAYLDPRKYGLYKYDFYEFSFEPFYIGKGKNNRNKRHLELYKSSKNGTNPFYDKIQKIYKCGYEPIIIKIIENISEKIAFELEVDFISKIGFKLKNTGSLLNITNGGNGGDTFTMKTKKEKKVILEKRSKSMVGKNKTPLKEETKIKISKTLTGRKCPKHSEYMKEKMKNVNEKYRNNLSLAQKKRWIDLRKENPWFGQKIVQLTKTGEFIKVWNSFFLKKENFNVSNIYSVCSSTNNRKTAHGFKWEFQDTYNR